MGPFSIPTISCFVLRKPVVFLFDCSICSEWCYPGLPGTPSTQHLGKRLRFYSVAQLRTLDCCSKSDPKMNRGSDPSKQITFVLWTTFEIWSLSLTRQWPTICLCALRHTIILASERMCHQIGYNLTLSMIRYCWRYTIEGEMQWSRLSYYALDIYVRLL